MIKILTLAIALTAFTFGASFAGCPACSGGGKDQPAPTATPAP
jgi:hypothetical protein